MGRAEWEADESEARAAWSLYVELVTRIAVQPMDLDHGLLREALTSLHGIFGTTRQILREAGPSVGASRESVGGIAISVLNHGIRPFLAKWHPLLLTWEQQKAPDAGLRAHERKWIDEPKLRAALEELRVGLVQYTKALATIAGVADKR